MIFRNIVFSAVVVGIIAGSLYGLFQQLQINPIIYAAEAYEVNSAEIKAGGHAHGSGSVQAAHDHGEAWAPNDGVERILSTLVANILVAIAFSLLMISVMSLHNLKSNKPRLNCKTGIIWGAGLMLSIFVAPSLLGLHPEIPGTISQALGQRQIWWVISVLATAAGLLLLYYGSAVFKITAVAWLALPQILGAPVSSTHGYANTDPAAIEALHQLSNQFVIMTTIGMTIFCTLIGALCGFACSRFVRVTNTSLAV